MSIIDVRQLEKSYGNTTVLKDVTFSIEAGEIFSLLGPNGAGKTTTLTIIEGLQTADSGEVHIFGHNINTHRSYIQQRIGVQLQATSLIPDLTAIEQVMLFARLYYRPISRRVALDLLKQMNLQNKADALPDTMSGGQKQRLVLALALVNEPEILFLDEPTAGLDPKARNDLWTHIRTLREQGCTIILTTHYMEEAQALSHRVGIMDEGQILAVDTPAALIDRAGNNSLITVHSLLPEADVQQLPQVEHILRERDIMRIYTSDVVSTGAALVALAEKHNQPLRDLHIQQPSLEDVFLNMTGKSLTPDSLTASTGIQ
jgi:ABC-2 type transport system ATP-binding protein